MIKRQNATLYPRNSPKNQILELAKSVAEKQAKKAANSGDWRWYTLSHRSLFGAGASTRRA